MAFGNYMGGYYPTQSYYAPANNAVPDMLNSYKAPYQTPQVPPVQQTQQNPFIWVQGEEAAKAYLVAPGNTVVLWDSEKPLIYVKSADASGMPNIRVIEYKDQAETPTKPTEHVCSCGDKFVAKEDFAALQGEVERLTKRIETLSKPKSRIMKRAEEEDDE